MASPCVRDHGTQGADISTPVDHHASRGTWDVALSLVLAVVSVIAAFVLPDGSTIRFILALPTLLLVPGYLLLQALMLPRARGLSRPQEALLSLAASPAIVGLLALATWAVPGGFRPRLIIGTVAGACFMLAAIILQRRGRARDRNGDRGSQLKRPGSELERR